MQKSAILIPYSVQIEKHFCNLNTVKDLYSGFLHKRLRAFKRLCNMNAALSMTSDDYSMWKNKSPSGGDGPVVAILTTNLKVCDSSPTLGTSAYSVENDRLWHPGYSSPCIVEA